MRLLRLAPLVLAAAVSNAPVHAAKLDKPVCDDLKVEQGLLQQKGVASDMVRGPEWAKANLPRERLKEIERLIHVEEQLAFRCPQPKKPAAPGEDEDGNVAAAPAKNPKAAKVVKPKPAPDAGEGSAPATATKKAVKTAPASAQSQQATQGVAQDAPKRAAAPKPKANDAYSPPPGAAANSPFKN
jgi:hypothetical protein